MHRREFLRTSLGTAAVIAGPVSVLLAHGQVLPAATNTDREPTLIDTNISLGAWPFRQLKYGEPRALVAKLREHHVEQAWTGTFLALLHKNLDAANARLADECRIYGDGLLLPFGSVNPVWPDWEVDLRRCSEAYDMPGIRLFPTFHNYRFDNPNFARLLRGAAELNLLVQIVLELEDERVQHPAISLPKLDPAQLLQAIKGVPTARIQLLNWPRVVKGPMVKDMIEQTMVCFDISSIESDGGVGKLIAGNHRELRGSMPAERLIYGSHAPFMPCENVILKLFESPLTRPQLNAIMHDNAVQLLAGVNPSAVPAVESDKLPGVTDFALDPSHYGVPNRDELVKLRIWDLHYHGFMADTDTIRQHRETMYYVNRMGIERVFALDIGGRPLDLEFKEDAEQRTLLEQESNHLSGMIRIEPSDPILSCAKMEKWIHHGPCVGIKYVGGNRDGIPCSHPNNIPIIELAQQLGAIVYIHTWLKVGGEPRRPGGGNAPGESTPMDVAMLAERFPNTPLICGHSGGDWELGVRAVRPYENVYFEFAGSDPHSGEVDLAVKELGIDRIVWGGHGPSRSYATELSKVFDADLTDEQRIQVLGGNLRRIATPIFQRKGYKV